MKGQKGGGGGGGGGGGKLMDLPSPHQDVVKEGMLSCKTVLSDGKVCTLKYEVADYSDLHKKTLSIQCALEMRRFLGDYIIVPPLRGISIFNFHFLIFDIKI